MASLHIAGSGDGDGDFEALVLEEVDCQLLLADAEALLESLDSRDAATSLEQVTLQKPESTRRRDVYRQKENTEREYLRWQNEELTQRLHALKVAKEAARRRDEEATSSGKMALSAWRAVAMHQLESRREAEEEQRWLRAEVNHHAIIIRDLERVMRKRISRADSSCGSELGPTKRARLEAMDAKMYKAYLTELNDLYAQTDEVFRDVRPIPTPGGLLEAGPVKKQHGDTEYFETIDVQKVSFSFQRTCDAIWELMHTLHRQVDREDYHDLPDAENTIAYRYSVPCSREGGGVVTLKIHFVSRRYVTSSSRMVQVWRVYAKVDGELEGMHSVDTGWSLVEPLEGSSVNGPTTLTRTCIRFVPMHFGRSEDGVRGKPKVDQFKQLLLETDREDIQAIAHTLDRLMLNDNRTADRLQEPGSLQ